ncbi:hypothetical protein OsJ_13182 [Oryza sativa Japonica Group]|uniref:Uncharacterized protein n=1 Tax=Oryza sativa subsp. japonica TaxID=39947 RepID=Q94GD7_ORYSJ|nr:hypothetical protein [Oryza sativa Japonica Group]EEE60213.1 hypothetical protein OsJ_13182 [Oryza sativa Japonica Group]
MTARLLERVHARPLGCTDSDKLEMSLQLTSVREQCARLLEAVEAGEIAGHAAAARLFGSYHSKLRSLIASMMRTLEYAMDEAKDFMSVTDEQDEAEEGDDGDDGKA